MTVQLAPPIVFQSFLSTGAPNAFGTVATYIAGTTTPQATYVDSTQTTQNLNPTPLNAMGQASIWLATNLVYKIIVFDALGNQINFQDQVAGSLTQAVIGSILYPQTASELAAGVTPVNFVYPPGDSRRNGITFDSGITDNKNPLQNWLNGNPGITLYLYGVAGQFAKVSDGVTCPANTSIVGLGYPELRWSAVIRTGTTAMGVTTHPGIESLGDNFSIQGCTLTGPSGAGVFTSGETGLLRVGPSAASRGNKFFVEDCELKFWGQFALLTEFMSNIIMRKCRNHDCGYSGGTHGSGFGILHENNEIFNITPGASGNAYGDNFTHNSAGYNTDPLVNAPVTAISLGATTQFTINIVSGSNPYTTGMVVNIFGLSGSNQLNGQMGTVTGTAGSSGNWTVTVAINSSSGVGTFVPTGTISAITLANPCVVTINNATTACPYTIGQLISFAGIVGTTQLNGTSAYISQIVGSSGAWQLTLGNVNSSAFTAWVSGGTTNSNGFICCPRQAAHPFCIAVISRNNKVYDIPLWSGIDFHGAYDSTAEGNETWNCYIHVQLSGSSGNAINYAGENNSIKNNRCNYNRRDGSPSTINAIRGSPVSYGINTVGGASVTHRNVVVEGNTLNGPMGDPLGFTGTTFGFGLQFTQNLVCSDNTLNGWNGVGLYLSHTDGVFSNNSFGAPSLPATNSYCIYAAGYCGELTVTDNKHSPGGGQAAAFGFDINQLGMNLRGIQLNNNFNSCTTPYGPGVPLTGALKSSVPMIIAPTGTMANNGAITLGTALSSATAFANCYLILPAGAIAAGVPAAASAYFTQMSNATAGTVFNNAYTNGVPTIPAAPTAFVTTGPGAYTGITGSQVAISLSIPGGSMGAYGRIRVAAHFTNNNTAGTKNSIIQVGPSPAVIANAQQTTNISIYHQHEFSNRGAQNVNVAQPQALVGPASTAAATVYQTVDTSIAFTFAFAMNNNTATDWQILESWLLEVFPG